MGDGVHGRQETGDGSRAPERCIACQVPGTGSRAYSENPDSTMTEPSRRRLSSRPGVAHPEYMIRYAVIFGVLAAGLGLVIRPVPVANPAAAAVAAAPPEVPEEILAAAAEGRFWRASRLMEDHLTTVADTSAQLLILAARLDAGWGNWAGVNVRLSGREWLDDAEAGAGLELLGRSQIEMGQSLAGASSLQRYLDRAELDDRARGLTEIRRGLALVEGGGVLQSEAALQAFSRAGQLLPSLSSWTSLYAAEAAAEAGDTAVVRERLDEAGAVVASGGWRIRTKAALAAGDTVAAREVTLNAARASGSPRAAGPAWVRLGELRMAAGDTVRAREAFARAMEVPGSIAAVHAARAVSDLRPSPDEWRVIAAIYQRNGNPTRAAEGYRAYLDAGVGTPAERARVRLALGQARFDAGRYEQAERGLLELAREPVDAAVAAEAMYVAGRAQYRQGRSPDGQRTFARLADEFPGEEASVKGMYLLADLKHDDLAIEEATRYYRRAADAATDLAEAGLAHMRLGGLAFLNGEHEDAATIYEEYRRRYPEGRRWAQATYWSARAYEALGRDEDARSRLREIRHREPLGYYGVRAAELLGEPVLGIPMADAPAREPRADSLVDVGMQRIALLAELDRRDDLVQEVERLRSSLSGDVAAEYALAERLTEHGYTLTAIGMGWELYRRKGGWDERLLRIVYPFPFQNLVLPETRERGLDPYLVAGLIRRESAFSPTVVSGAGAIGLMQVMPETGRALARGAGLAGYDPELLKQAEVNVHLGTRYLADMLERFDGDLPLVLSAYNAGPTRARRWRSMPEASDPELFAERIPFGETRDYVRNVLMHRALYRALYPVLPSGPEHGS